MDWILEPWPWYIGGPLIGLTVPLLLLFVGKPFGISSSFRHLCSICSPRTNLSYLKENNWLKESWNLFFIGGILIGSYIGMHFLSSIPFPLLPAHYHSWTGMSALFIGGLLVGFGTRYADGCTSGHSIMGLSMLKWPSLIATVSFFIGGLIVVGLTNFIS
ncbi:YeeE/YedE family protein [Candidatus Latescibacteria bacterium]|nr:YeeE/YedE family protein [Candidatus Latescibacterota bacterium]